MHSKTTPFLHNADQPLHKHWVLFRQFSKLVNDDEKMWHWLVGALILVAQRDIFSDLISIGFTENVFAAFQLAFKCYQCSLGQFSTEVGDKTDRVRDLLKCLECRAPFEVYQHEVDQV